MTSRSKPAASMSCLKVTYSNAFGAFSFPFLYFSCVITHVLKPLFQKGVSLLPQSDKT